MRVGSRMSCLAVVLAALGGVLAPTLLAPPASDTVRIMSRSPSAAPTAVGPVAEISGGSGPVAAAPGGRGPAGAAAVPPVGTGVLGVVSGSAPAPRAGRVRTVRVEVEGGLPIDPADFAGFAMSTLNDPRSWGRDGATSFARTDGDAEIVVVLASPQTSARLCRPLDTGGKLSCRVGPRAVITHHRWVHGHPGYEGDVTAYRRYVVNHEVGHVLGHGHVECPGPGALAPVMQQQTLGLDGCRPNGWPYP